MALDQQKPVQKSKEELLANMRQMVDSIPNAAQTLEDMETAYKESGEALPTGFNEMLEYARSKGETASEPEELDLNEDEGDNEVDENSTQTRDDAFLEEADDNEQTEDETSLVTAVQSINDAPSMSPLEAIKPAVMGNLERHKHSIVPVKDDKGRLAGYEVVSPSGKQKFVVDKNNMEMKILHDTIIGNEADQQEVLSVYDLVFKVRSAMKAIGVTEKDLPTDPMELAEKARLLIVKATEIQRARTEFEMENATQAFLRLYTRVMSGDKNDYNRLNSDQKEQVKTFGDILMVHMLKKMGITDEETAVAQTVVDVDRLLRERKATAQLMAGQGTGQAIGGFLGGLVSTAADHVTKAGFGEKKAANGIVGAVKATAGEVVDGVVSGVGSKIGEATEWVKTQRAGEDTEEE